MASKTGVTVVLDKTQDVLKGIAALTENRVYAGVPSTKAQRSDEDGEPINNAALMYIHENGAPEVGIPPRPVIHPAIKDAQSQIEAALKATGVAALDGGAGAVMRGYTAVGLIAQNAMRTRITEGPFVPLKPATIANRARQRGTKRRKGEQQYLDMVKGGMSPAAAQSAAGIRPLISTGQLRQSLTYVIRKLTWNGKPSKL